MDFVDVPGHDRLVGNMLVGAGEIDAALLVVAADDGPNAQTLEHLELLDALGIADGLAVVTKADLAPDADRRRGARGRGRGAARADDARRLAGARGVGADRARGSRRCGSRWRRCVDRVAGPRSDARTARGSRSTASSR